MEKKLNNPKLALWLIKLFVVILVIGILFFGITQSTRLLRISKLRTAQSITTNAPVNSMDGVILWLESTLDKSFVQGEMVDTTIGDPGTITTWNDINPKTTTPNNAIQINPDDKPRYRISGINGLPVVHFDGISDYINYDAARLANHNYTIFVVERRRSDARSSLFIVSDKTNHNLHLGYKNTNTLLFSQNGNEYETSIESYSIPITRMHSYRFKSANGKDYYINGRQVKMTGSNSSPTGLLSSSGPRIGGKDGNWYNGDIGEIIIFNRYLNDLERVIVENYLKAKWGVK